MNFFMLPFDVQTCVIKHLEACFCVVFEWQEIDSVVPTRQRDIMINIHKLNRDEMNRTRREANAPKYSNGYIYYYKMRMWFHGKT